MPPDPTAVDSGFEFGDLVPSEANYKKAAPVKGKDGKPNTKKQSNPEAAVETSEIKKDNKETQKAPPPSSEELKEEISSKLEKVKGKLKAVNGCATDRVFLMKFCAYILMKFFKNNKAKQIPPAGPPRMQPVPSHLTKPDNLLLLTCSRWI